MQTLRAGLSVLGMFGGLPLTAGLLESDRLWVGIIIGVLSLALMLCGIGLECPEKEKAPCGGRNSTKRKRN